MGFPAPLGSQPAHISQYWSSRLLMLAVNRVSVLGVDPRRLFSPWSDPGSSDSHATGASTPGPNLTRWICPLISLIAAACLTGHGHPSRPTSSLWSWPDLLTVLGQPEPLSGQTNPREERPATQPGRSTLQRATHAIGSRPRRVLLACASWPAGVQ
jgi:hypothetical protein